MKKIFVLSLVASMFLFGCGPDDSKPNPDGQPADKLAVTSVVKENKSLVVKFSGTNCPPCGSWGWTAMEDLIFAVGDEGVCMVAYGQNFVAKNYITPEATTLQNTWGATGFPHFGANGSVTTVPRTSGVNVQAEKDEIYQRVNDHKAATVVANTTLNYKIEDGKINMKYMSEAFAGVDAPYLAIYILENKVKGYQAGYSDPYNALHKFVLRGEATGGQGYGSPVDGLSVGTPVSGEMTFPLLAEWDESHISLGVVMYNKVGTKFEFVNASFGNLVE